MLEIIKGIEPGKNQAKLLIKMTSRKGGGIVGMRCMMRGHSGF